MNVERAAIEIGNFATFIRVGMSMVHFNDDEFYLNLTSWL